MHKIDVHIAHQPNENPLWFNHCHDSLQGHDINLHNFNGTEGNIFKTRATGFVMGVAPYVSFVDPDDLVIGDPFTKCLEVLEDNPDIGMVYTNSYMRQESGKRAPLFDQAEWTMEWHIKTPLPIHPLVVIRRELMEQALSDIAKNCTVMDDCKMFPEQLIYSHVVNLAPAYFLNDVFGYEWRYHKKGAHRAANTQEKQAVRDYIKQLLIGNHKNLNHKY